MGLRTRPSTPAGAKICLIVIGHASLPDPAALWSLLAASLLAQKPKKKKPDEEPRPQALEVIPDPPEAVVAESGRLSFQVSPLSDKGLLSQQVHDALKALARLNHGVPIVKAARVRRRIGRPAPRQGHRGRRPHRQEADAPRRQHHSGGRPAAARSASGDRSDVVGKEGGESERGRVCSGGRKRERRGCRGAIWKVR